MSDLKNIQNSFSPIAHQIQNFPPYFFYRGRVMMEINHFRAGLAYGFASTGARSDYEDYSGHLRMDQKVSSNNIGIIIGRSLPINERWNGGFNLIRWNTFSNISITQSVALTASSQQATQQSTFTSSSSMYELDGDLYYKLSSRLSVGLFAGYNFDLKGSSKANGQTYNFKTDWSGIRTGVFLTLVLTNPKSKEQ
jgi:hypothetical protein